MKKAIFVWIITVMAEFPFETMAATAAENCAANTPEGIECINAGGGAAYYSVTTDGNEKKMTLYARTEGNAVSIGEVNSFPAGVTKIELIGNIREIGYNAFNNANNTTVKSVIIPDSVTSIGVQAFKGMSGVESLSLPNSLTSIGYNAFNGMTGVTGTLKIPDSVTTIAQSAFYGMSGVENLIIGNNVESIGGNAFQNMSAVTSLTIGNSVTSIGDYAFTGMSNLKNLTIPDLELTEDIGLNAFAVRDTALNKWVPNLVENLTISANMLQKYLNAKGGLAEGANLICTTGDCAYVLAAWDEAKGTNYASSVTISVSSAGTSGTQAGGSGGSGSGGSNGLFKGERGKRIYTVEQANAVSGKKNKVMIRYR